MYVLIIGFSLLCFASAQISVIREWKYLNFTWPSEEVLHTAVSRGMYIPENILIAGVNYYDGNFYLTLPRMHDGVPSTLVVIPESGNDTGPLLQPYPTWAMNVINDCNAIQNAQNIEIDSRGRMWIIDGGRTATMAKIPVIKCPPKILIHDIKENRTVMTYSFPQEVANRETSFLYDLVIDETEDDASYAYITDNSGRDPGIIVFSLKLMESWKIRHSPSMRAQRDAVNFEVDGTAITTPINIAGIAIGPNMNKDRLVYYSPLSSFHLYAMNSSSLKNVSNSMAEFTGRVYDLGMRPSQTDGMIMDDAGVLYYGLVGISSLAKWDTKTPLATSKIIAKDPTYIQWPNSFAFNNRGDIIVLSNRLQKFIYGRMDLNEENFRLLSWHVGSKSYLHAPKITTTVEPTSQPEPEPEPEPTTQPSTTIRNDNHIHFHMVSSTPSTTTDMMKDRYDLVHEEHHHNASSGVGLVVNYFLLFVSVFLLR